MAVLTKSQEGVEEGKPTKNGTLRAKKYNRREALAGYLFISPWIIGFLVFTLGCHDLQLGDLLQLLQPGEEHHAAGRTRTTTGPCSTTRRSSCR